MVSWWGQGHDDCLTPPHHHYADSSFKRRGFPFNTQTSTFPPRDFHGWLKMGSWHWSSATAVQLWHQPAMLRNGLFLSFFVCSSEQRSELESGSHIISTNLQPFNFQTSARDLPTGPIFHFMWQELNWASCINISWAFENVSLHRDSKKSTDKMLKLTSKQHKRALASA